MQEIMQEKLRSLHKENAIRQKAILKKEKAKQ